MCSYSTNKLALPTSYQLVHASYPQKVCTIEANMQLSHKTCIPLKQRRYSCPLLISTACIAGKLLSLMKPRVRSSVCTSSVRYMNKNTWRHQWVLVLGMSACSLTLRLPVHIEVEERETRLVAYTQFFVEHLETMGLRGNCHLLHRKMKTEM